LDLLSHNKIVEGRLRPARVLAKGIVMSVPTVLGVFLCGIAVLSMAAGASAQELAVTNYAGIRLQVDGGNTDPSLEILLPGQPSSDPGIEVLFPEHVTARPHGSTEARHLYLFRPGKQRQRPLWRRDRMTLEYKMPLEGGVLLTARATLEEDGVRYYYEFASGSGPAYDVIQAVTDPRMGTELLRDVRLERTYVHHANGFDLLASETPARLTMPLREWLPNRYRAPFSWPVDTNRVEKQQDGITWYNKSRRIDEPFVATISTDGKWIMATFARDPGNVWTNPELTCQHADPQTSLPSGSRATQESKSLLVQGTLADVLKKVQSQRAEMK
jgi:hypothetical protein